MPTKKATLLSLDLEMTGLDPNTELILEVGAVAVDDDLNEVASFQVLVNPGAEAIRCIGDIVYDMHTANGLLSEIERDGRGVQSAERAFVDWMTATFHGTTFPIPVLGDCFHLDWEFLRREMPMAFNLLHYEHCDIGSANALLKRLGVNLPADPGSKVKHRSLSDARAAVQWAKSWKLWLGTSKAFQT